MFPGPQGKSVAGNRISIIAKYEPCFDRESNTGPSDLQSDALPTELSKLGLLAKRFKQY